MSTTIISPNRALTQPVSRLPLSEIEEALRAAERSLSQARRAIAAGDLVFADQAMREAKAAYVAALEAKASSKAA